MFGGQVGLAGHLTVGDHVNLGGQSGVTGNVKANQTLIGSPVMEPGAFFKAAAIMKRLPDMYKEMSALRKELEELKKTK
jgi:UDP-3-O-[3-hydroxymyristoyl] glucosamine N-acyltransferase